MSDEQGESSPSTPSDEAAATVVVTRRGRSKAARAAEATPLDTTRCEALAPKIEAVLLTVDRPMQVARLATVLDLLPEGADDSAHDPAARSHALSLVEASIALLNQQLMAGGRAYRVERLSGGYRVMTLPEHVDVLARLHAQRTNAKLSRAAVETLAVIAYRQPLTRAGLEAIRGVACGEVLRTLIDRRLIIVKGRADELGRPLLYATSPQFLEHFGLASIKDLPAPEAAGELLGGLAPPVAQQTLREIEPETTTQSPPDA